MLRKKHCSEILYYTSEKERKLIVSIVKKNTHKLKKASHNINQKQWHMQMGEKHF